MEVLVVQVELKKDRDMHMALAKEEKVEMELW